jgi:magnesium chelatase subunit D
VGAALAERLGVWLDLNELSPSDIHAAWQGNSESDGLQIRLSPGALARAREQLPQVQASDEQMQALCAAALGLGIGSLRVPSLALRVACGHAALNGRSTLDADDLGFAARCVLAPRATQWPAEPSAQEAEPAPQEDSHKSRHHSRQNHPKIQAKHLRTRLKKTTPKTRPTTRTERLNRVPKTCKR